MKIDTLSKSDNTQTLNQVISGIKELINLKNLEPGEKLPSERMLSDLVSVSIFIYY